MKSSGAPATHRARLSPRIASITRKNLRLPSLAHHLAKNTKTNPTPTTSFPQVPVTTWLKKNSPTPTLPNCGDKAGSNHPKSGLEQGSNQTPTNGHSSIANRKSNPPLGTHDLSQ